ncbi:rod-determining factor RdfA [Halosimplex amylolyticum]|uniref:rod-determining factor RdfA n=1 Tax=Halosimplex amylolyticum TaxID=3396616 RepID=UPI003F567A77
MDEETAPDVGSTAGGPGSKVAALIERYDLVGLGDDLESRWTADGDERMSLRELADYVNESLIAAALRASDTQPVDGVASNYYRLLTSDDVSSGTRIEAENELESRGVDVDQLESDFVSRQAIHTYLTSERDASYESPDRSDSERADDRLQTVQRLKNRLATVAERVLTELEGSGYLSVGDARVTVLVSVQCRDCGEQYAFADIIANGGCDC